MSVKRQLVMTVMVLLLLQGTNVEAKDDAVTAIKQAEEELNLAFNKFDASALERLWGDDLAFVFPSGAIASKAERLAGFKPSPNIPSSTNESVDVRVYGDVAVAIVVSKWTGTSNGKPFATRFRATHVWAKRVGRWEMVSAHVSQMKE